MGWSCQRPARRAKERDEEAIEAWVKTTWPKAKNAIRRAASIVFEDESGMSLTHPFDEGGRRWARHLYCEPT
jgi:hypothetical protein